MKQLKFIGWASILILLITASCREDIIDPNQKTNIPDPEVRVEASIKGQVIDEELMPISGALIKVGTDQILTDENGYFSFENKVLNESGTLIRAEKTGYYLGVKMFNPTLGDESYMAIQLMRKELVGTFTAGTGGTITTSDNASIEFGANSIMYENGTDFNGQVNVYAKWIDPTHDMVNDRMPGDLRAVDKDGERVQLGTYGMVAVELEASNGTKLQIKNGSSATLTMPVPEEILAQAPGTIPLWSFDDQTGYWVEESTAVLNGSNYVGEVPHFSFWNCDAPFPVVQLEGSVTDSNGNGIPNVSVTITASGIGTGYGWTNNEGEFNGKIPKDLALTLTVYNQCQDVVYMEEIGPYSTDAVLAPIVISTVNTITVSGTLVKCDGSPVTNGYAYTQGVLYTTISETDANGYFSFTSLLCEDVTATLTGYDVDELKASEPVAINLSANGSDVDLGNIEVCDDIEEIIHIEIPDFNIVEDIFIYNAYGSSNDTLQINISAEGDSSYFYITIDAEDFDLGTVPTLGFTYWVNSNNNPNGNGYYFYCGGICPETVITTNEGSGGSFEAEFAGTVNLETGGGTEHDILVTMNVILQ